jgi:hypothetical protein
VTVQEAEAVQGRIEAPGAFGTIPVEALAWGAVALVFVGLRLAPVWQAPVGGAELIHLSGAWQASIGQGDDRFVPTLLQGLAALLLKLSISEVPTRLAAVAVTASVPAALYLLRPILSGPGALLALVVLALDPFALTLGAGASALAWDIALALWLFVALVRGPLPYWAWAGIAFLVVTAGPVPLPLVAAALGLYLVSGRRAAGPHVGAIGVGAGAGVLAASARFGLGFDGLRVPPLDLFAAGYAEMWATATTGELLVVYGLPVLVSGAAAAAWTLARIRRDGGARRETVLLLAWLGVGVAWLVSSLGSHNPAVLAAVTLPAAILLGPAAGAAIGAMVRADWRYARLLIPLAGVTGAVALTIVAEWARLGRVGGGSEQLVVAALALASVGALAAVALERKALPALAAAALLILGLPATATAAGVAFGWGYDAMPSPVSPERARNLRDVAIDLRAQRGGPIVIHPDLRDAMTWPFRDSGEVLVASRPPADAAVVILPAGAPPPGGMGRLGFSDWALLEKIEPPTRSLLDFVRWRIDRYRLRIEPLRVDVYTPVAE